MSYFAFFLIISFETQCMFDIYNVSLDELHFRFSTVIVTGATAVDSAGLESLMPEFLSRLFKDQPFLIPMFVIRILIAPTIHPKYTPSMNVYPLYDILRLCVCACTCVPAV